MNHIRPDICTICVGLAASMGAFREAEWGKGDGEPEPEAVKAAIEAGAKLTGPAAFGGLGF